MKLLSVCYITSKHDRNGNTYSAIRVTNLATRQTASALTDSTSNDRADLMKLLGGDWENVRLYAIEREEKLGVREFNRECKSLPYIGNDFPGWIKENVGFEFNAKYAPGRRVLIQFTNMPGSIYTTVQQIRDGIGQHTKFNLDVHCALLDMVETGTDCRIRHELGWTLSLCD